MTKLFAAVSPDGKFDFGSIRKRRAEVSILPSDEKYGEVKAKPVEMVVYIGDLPADANDLWDEHQIAWVWQNFDGTYWWDTFSRTKKEAADWAINPERLKAIGTKLVPVHISLKEAGVTAAA